jgi:23S rRNA (uridine2552-2'-O)-methyltransferase
VTYRARSAHKLLSLAKSHPTLLSPGKMVVDLGAAPGGWSQVAAQLLRGRGMVWAVDVLGMEGIKGVELLRGDFLNGTVQEELRRRIEEYRQGVDGQVHGGSEHVGRVGVDTVLSDMMAPMSGVRLRDVQASLDLVGAATSFARQVLRQARPWEEATGVGRSKVHPGGNLVCVPLHVAHRAR